MAETTDAAVRRIVHEFDFFSSTFDRCMEQIDDAICNFDDTLFNRARPLIADAGDVPLFIRGAGYVVDVLRPFATERPARVAAAPDGG